jgi:cytochrome b561
MHWGTAFCVVMVAATILLRELIEDKFWRGALMDAHRQLGLLVLICVALRLAARARHGMINHMESMPWPIRAAATGTHWALYGLLVTLPLLGWASTNAHNLPVRLFGLVELPALAVVDSELADELSDHHALAFWALLGLVCAHAGAALYHHFVRRDAVLWAMLPGQSEPPKTATPPGETTHVGKPASADTGLIH